VLTRLQAIPEVLGTRTLLGRVFLVSPAAATGRRGPLVAVQGTDRIVSVSGRYRTRPPYLREW
ncbi:hypothetical protein ABT329_17675, partial [Streptomyces minutiscleroticus]